jgi:hypothetical protein
MSGTCSTHGDMRNTLECTEFRPENVKERDGLGDVVVCWRITSISKFTLKNWV